jgi:hypothetical protein
LEHKDYVYIRASWDPLPDDRVELVSIDTHEKGMLVFDSPSRLIFKSIDEMSQYISENIDNLYFKPIYENLTDSKADLITWMVRERTAKYKQGIYHYTQIKLAYNSNHIEGSTLTEAQTETLFDNEIITADDNDSPMRKIDVIETNNHFSLFNYILDNFEEALSEDNIKKYHFRMSAK